MQQPHPALRDTSTYHYGQALCAAAPPSSTRYINLPLWPGTLCSSPTQLYTIHQPTTMARHFVQQPNPALHDTSTYHYGQALCAAAQPSSTRYIYLPLWPGTLCSSPTQLYTIHQPTTMARHFVQHSTFILHRLNKIMMIPRGITSPAASARETVAINRVRMFPLTSLIRSTRVELL